MTKQSKADNRFAFAPASPQALPERAIYVDDNLPIMRGINSDSVDLIYLDPPFNTGRGFPLPGGEKRRVAFTDTWKWSEEHDQHRYALGLDSPNAVAVVDTARLVNGSSHGAYLVYMGVRLLEMRRILKPTGSIYFHCDPTMSHSVKLMMDAVFGRENFRNEIIWSYRTGGVSKRHFPRKHDNIFSYGGGGNVKHNPPRERIYYDKPFFGIMKDNAGRYYADVYVRDMWEIPAVINVSKERADYPTQKPLALLERIIKASSNKGDIVLDPFCGCATTCIAAQIHKRQWIGIDLSAKARELVQKRLDDIGIDAYTKRHNIPIAYPDSRPRRTDLPRQRIDRKEWLPRLYEGQRGLCNGCRLETAAKLMDIDHILAKARGGGNESFNLQLLCRACNTLKGEGTMEELFEKLAKQETAEKIRQWREGIEQKITAARFP